jgi:glutathione S-transferase
VARFWALFDIEASEEQRALKHQGGNKALAGLERGLDGRDWLVGGRYSAADISCYAYTHVAAEGGFELAGYPSVSRWVERVADQPGHIAIDE